MVREITYVLLAVLLTTGRVWSAELTLDMRQVVNGSLRDGEKLATGRLVCREAHSGFQVRLEAPTQGEAAERYIIRGKNNIRHELKVRPEGSGWHTVLGGWGVKKTSTEEHVIFNIVADGQQEPVADEYVLQVTGFCIMPE
ncbi:adhesin [Salmonella enterica]|nr:adhesin [Salmonella enterica]EGK7719935.1 adhesin [Salmonella enterica]